MLVIWKLDRLGRTVKGLVDFVADLQGRGVQFRSLTDGIDTTTPAGRFFFHVMASLAQMERELLAERTRAGLAAARRRGRVGGRKRRMTPGKVESARKLLKGGMAPRDVAQEPRRLDPDALPLGARIEPVNHHTPGCHLNISPSEDRCFFLRCYRNPIYSPPMSRGRSRESGENPRFAGSLRD